VYEEKRSSPGLFTRIPPAELVGMLTPIIPAGSKAPAWVILYQGRWLTEPGWNLAMKDKFNGKVTSEGRPDISDIFARPPCQPVRPPQSLSLDSSKRVIIKINSRDMSMPDAYMDLVLNKTIVEIQYADTKPDGTSWVYLVGITVALPPCQVTVFLNGKLHHMHLRTDFVTFALEGPNQPTPQTLSRPDLETENSALREQIRQMALAMTLLQRPRHNSRLRGCP
jgi:hypothetical protein